MKIKLWLSIGLIVGTLALAVLCWLLLPEAVIVQLKITYQAPRTVSKLLAISIPTAVGIGFSVLGMVTKSNRFKLYFTLSFISLGAFFLLLIANM